MTNPLLLASIVLLAILVGAMLPVLYQFYQTLKTARALLDTTGPHLARTLDQVGQAADRIDRLGSSLEMPAQTLGPLLEAASTVRHSIGSTGQWLRMAASVGGAVAPAVIAGVRAMFWRPRSRRRADDQPSVHVTRGNHART